MTKKRAGSPSNLPGASSAMGPIARGLIEDYLGPDRRVVDMERLFTPLMQGVDGVIRAASESFVESVPSLA
jgi:hypothetical protein